MNEKTERLVALDFHRRKLVVLLGELLKKADEIDHESRGKQSRLPADWQQSMASTCTELASLNQTVAGIEAFVKSKNVVALEESLLRCTDIANHLSKRLNELKARMSGC